MKEKTIALVGVSENPEKYGFKIFKDLIAEGVNISGINPNGRAILGKKIYRSLKDLVELPDLVITVAPPNITEKIVEECYQLGVKEIWMQPGSESDAAIQKARKYGIAAIHHACIMVQNGLW